MGLWQGTSTVGTLGLDAIKADCRITFAQDESARDGSTPRSAIAVACEDFVLSLRHCTGDHGLPAAEMAIRTTAPCAILCE